MLPSERYFESTRSVWGSNLRFRIQFLDRSANVVSEMHSFASSAAYVVDLLKAVDWPLVAVSLRIWTGTAMQSNFYGVAPPSQPGANEEAMSRLGSAGRQTILGSKAIQSSQEIDRNCTRASLTRIMWITRLGFCFV